MLGPQVVRLRPAPHCRTRILSYSLRVAPEKHFINWQQDPQSNYLARLVFPEPTRELLVEVDLVAEMAVFNPFDFFLEPEAEKFPFSYDRRSTTNSSRSSSRAADAAVHGLSRRLRGRVRSASTRRPAAARATAPHHRFPRRPQPAALAGHQVRHPPGTRRADAGGNARPKAPVPAATRPGCSASCCATAASRRASSAAT